MKIINEIILKVVTVSLIIVIFTNSSCIFAEIKVYDKKLSFNNIYSYIKNIVEMEK